MSFLDTLLTLEDSLEEGQQLITFPRTWRHNLPWKAQPFCYKAHQTQAGLYFVLPHNQDGSLFTHYPYPKQEETKNAKSPNISVDSFHLKKIATTNGKKGVTFESVLSRSTFHNPTKTGLKISTSYNMNAEGLPLGLQIEYTIVLHREHYKKVSFEVARNRGMEGVSAKGPKIEDNLDNPYKDFWPTDYDSTLQNLMELISEGNLGPAQFYQLLTLDYVEQHLLH